MAVTTPIEDDTVDTSLAQARAAIGVGEGSTTGARAGWRWTVVGSGGMLVAFAPLMVFLVGRYELAAGAGIVPAEIDDRAVSLLAVMAVTAVLVGMLVQARMGKMRVVLGALAAGAAALLAVTSTNDAAFDAAAVLGGIGAGLVVGVLPALVSDAVEPSGRIRALRMMVAGKALAMVVVSIGVVTDQMTVSAAAIAGLGVIVAALMATMTIPTMARDERAVRSLITPEPAPTPPPPRAQIARRLLARDTFGRVGLAVAAEGLLTFAIPLFGTFHLIDQFDLATDEAATFLLISGSVSMLTHLLGLRATERAYSQDPGSPSRRAARLLVMSAGLLVVAAVVPELTVSAAALIGAIALGLSAGGRGRVVLYSTTPSALRPGASAALAFSAPLGAIIGFAVLAGIDRRFGTSWALFIAAVPIAALAPSLARSARSASRELDRTLQQALHHEQIVVQREAGHTPPLLACRGIEFSYGQVQVLFDVDFTVDEGEMVALLGTNGAGKSTLLRVISGLGIPQHGSVRLDGDDVTFMTPGDRVHAGVTQVPGGKAVFGPLSVLENLRVYGHALGRDRAAVERGIEESFAAFPRLAERKDQAAQTMSGGEQQMLALSKALILQPRLLLIDELSLGLAPKVVAELLEMVRRINATGTAVVLVEQSVNVALSLAHHAYYMEKGEIRFDGPTAELLERPDVLRSVYLKGAAEGLGA